MIDTHLTGYSSYYGGYAQAGYGQFGIHLDLPHVGYHPFAQYCPKTYLGQCLVVPSTTIQLRAVMPNVYYTTHEQGDLRIHMKQGDYLIRTAAIPSNWANAWRASYFAETHFANSDIVGTPGNHATFADVEYQAGGISGTWTAPGSNFSLLEQLNPGNYNVAYVSPPSGKDFDTWTDAP